MNPAPPRRPLRVPLHFLERVLSEGWGYRADHWGSYVPRVISVHLWHVVYEGHTLAGWHVVYEGHTLADWHSYLPIYSTVEWAVASTSHTHHGQSWSTKEWYDWCRANVSRWSGLVWALTFLNTTPSIAAHMLMAANRQGSGKSSGSKL